MKVGGLCKLLDVPYRHARYVLEEGILPAGVESDPGRGDHRELTPQQAFWLAVVLNLKQNGIKAHLAGEIASLCHEGVRTVTKGLGWDWMFDPFHGKFDTTNRWYADVGDLKYFRLATDASPSGGGKLEEFPWAELGTRRNREVMPVIIIRIDLARLACLFSERSRRIRENSAKWS